MPVVEQALSAGEVTPAHAATLGRAVAGASPGVGRALSSPEGQERVVALARAHDGRRFAQALSALTASWDPAAHQGSHEAARAARFLTLSHAPDATWIRGRVDAWVGKKLRLALESVSPRPADGDERTPEQRNADALEALAEHALNAPDAGHGTERPQVTVVVSEDTWASLREAKTTAATTVGVANVTGEDSTTGENGATGEGVPAEGARPTQDVDLARVPGGIDHMIDALQGQDPVRDSDGDAIPPSQLARLLCDCDISRLALSAAGEILDHGRKHRLFSPAQRRAITIRDGGCAWPDCSMPARYTEIHHLNWWHRDGGHTSTDNGIALCSYHHHLTH
jgi:hypothetical protein